MILELTAKVTIIEKFEQKNKEYSGFCRTFEEKEIQGQIEFTGGHPNIDAYTTMWEAYENSDLLLDYVGFNPELDYEIEDLEVNIWGDIEEWKKQVEIFHDGYYLDNPKECLDMFVNYENMDIDEHLAQKVLEKFE